MQIPESIRSIWESIVEQNKTSGNVTQEQFNQIINAANSDGIIDNQEAEFLSYIESKLMTSSTSNEGKGSKPIEFVDPQFGKVPSSMVETWKKASSDGIITEDELQQLKNDGKSDGKVEDEEINFLITLVNNSKDSKDGYLKLNRNNISESITTPFGTVPSSLKETWNKISADGTISIQDLDELISAATPNENSSEIDDQEREFLLNIRNAFKNSGGNPISISENTRTNSSPPTLLNWPGYNTQTKQALKNAYGELAIGTKMPLLRNDTALEVAKNFGVSSVEELQSMIGAKVDGKFGPETYFKAKAFVANLINSNPYDQRIQSMLSVLGNNDIEVQKMKEKISSQYSNNHNTQNNQNTQNNSNNDNINNKSPVIVGDTDISNPESIKAFQNKVNLLSSIYNKQKGTSFESINVDGQLTEEFADKLRNMEKVIGKPVAQAIAEIDSKLKSKGFNPLNNRNVDFVKLTDTDIQIIGEPKDLTRINAAKELLSKLGFNVENFEIYKPQNPGKNGDLVLKSNSFELAIFDNVSIDNRYHNKYGDLHIVGKYDNKNIDVSYWENDRRGEKSIKQFNRFYLKALVDGKELLTIKQSESILSRPLIKIK